MFETSNPKQPFYVANKINLFPGDIKVLIKLYQPIVGATAVSLYQTLIQDYDAYAMVSDSQGIYSLQEELDCSLKDMFLALHKLEAVGLVKTYLADSIINKIIIFQLMNVPSAQDFFSTALLASLLKEKIGAIKFHTLSHAFAKELKRAQKPIKDAQDVSASFFDVFHLSQAEAITPSDDVKKAASENTGQKIVPAQVNDHSNIDWEFLKQRFEMYQIPPEQVTLHQREIASIMTTYDLNEKEFSDKAMYAMREKPTQYELNMQLIEERIAEESQNVRFLANKGTPKEEKLDLSGLSHNEQEIVKNAMDLSPYDFLHKVKKQYGGQVYSSETYTINVINRKYHLPVSVLNMIVYTCLTYNSVVSYNLAKRIAEDWTENQVGDAVTALKRINARKQDNHKEPLIKTQVVKKKTAYGKKRVEEGTDWSKKKAKVNKSITAEEAKNFFKNLEDKYGMK